MSTREKRPLGRILLEQRAITPAVLERALLRHTPGEKPLASHLIEEGVIDEHDALKALSTQRGVPGVDLRRVCIRLTDLDLLPREFAEQHRALVLLAYPDRIFVAMADPSDQSTVETIELSTKRRLFPYVALTTRLNAALEEAFAAKKAGREFYVGELCAPETVERMGGATSSGELAEEVVCRKGDPRREPTPRSTPAPPRSLLREPWADREGVFRPSSPASPPTPDTNPAIVVDERMRTHVDAEVADDDFGTVDSAVSDISGLLAEEGVKRIVLVDADDGARRSLASALRVEGLVVLEAADGKDAIELIRATTPSLIILDAMLPTIHGFEIAKTMIGSERFRHIPIIMTSADYGGWRFAEDMRRSYGVVAFFEKPLALDVVTSRVLGALSRGPLPSENVDHISGDAERLLNEGVLAYRAGDVERARELFEQGVRLDPLAFRLRFHLGLLFGKTHRPYDAIYHLERAVGIHGQHFSCLKNLAIVYQQAGFQNKAAETWERALKYAPDPETAAAIREHLLTLLQSP